MTGQVRGTVVVTGAGSGIGRRCVTRLSSAGFHVIATVLTAEEQRAVAQETAPSSRSAPDGPRVSAFVMDVTNAMSIAAASELVAQQVGEHGLAGLVHCAGFAITCPIELVPLDELRRIFEVNVIGQVAVIQAFMPMLRTARGRIVMLSSMLGATSLPFCGPYCATKFATEAVADALRAEVRAWGIEVCVIRPGAVRSELWATAADANARIANRLGPAASARYGGSLGFADDDLHARISGSFLDPDAVARVAEVALTVARPRTRYTIGRDARTLAWLGALPDRMRDRLLMLTRARLLHGRGTRPAGGMEASRADGE